MTVGGHRLERVAEEMRNELSLMLAGDLKDPRLAVPIVITEVRMRPGMRTARVFVRIEGQAEERGAALAGLEAASGYVRRELAERLRLRRAPELLFVADESEDYGQRIDDLLRKVSQPDKS